MNTFLKPETGRTVFASVAPEVIAVDCTEDFILPDYRPEIRRFLRLDAKCVPSGHFMGADRAEFGGSLRYTLYYTDAEGKLTAVPLESRYEYSVPFTESAAHAVFTEETVESVSCRPSGPRKISIRTRVRACPRIYVEKEAQLSPESLLPKEAGTPELLIRRRECAELFCGSSGEMTAEVTLPIEGVEAESLHLLSTDAEAQVESARAEEGRILCRGTLHLKLLAERGAELFSETRRVPFETEIAADGARQGDSVGTRVYCHTAEASVREMLNGAEILVDICYNVTAESHRNRPFFPVADLYSPTIPLSIEKGVCKSERFAGGVTGSFTVDGNGECREEESETSVLDTAVSILSSSLTLLPRRVIVTGDAKATMLLAPIDGGAPLAGELTFPFRIEADLPEEVSPEDRCEYSLSPVTATGRIERGEKSCAAELALSLSVYHAQRDEVPERISADSERTYERDDLYRIYYPVSADSLWSVGKRYGIPVSALCRENGLSLSDVMEADDPKVLDGIMWLSVSPS